MPIKLGNTNISTIYKGTTPISAIYKGTTLLYQSASWELYSKVYFYNELVPTTINGKNVLNKAKIVKISGNGVVENQHITESGPHPSYQSWTIDNSAGSSALYATHRWNCDSSYRLTIGHKYLLCFLGTKSYRGNGACRLYPNVANQQAYVFDFKSQNANIFTVNTIEAPNSIATFNTIVGAGTTLTIDGYLMLVDLTLMFGTGNEPTTLTDNRIQNILNRGYIPYNTGTYKGTDIGVISTKDSNNTDLDTLTFKYQGNGVGTAHDTMEITNSAYVFTKNNCLLDLNQVSGWYYDTALQWGTNQITNFNADNAVAKELLCEKYSSIRFNGYASSGDNNLISFRNNGYVYVKNGNSSSQPSGLLLYPLATPQVITIPKKHLGIVDLGSLSYGNVNSVGRIVSLTAISNIKFPSAANVKTNVYCSNYLTYTADQTYVGTEGISIEIDGKLDICDKSFIGLTSQQVKEKLSGYYLFYETESEVADIIDTIDIESGGTITTDSEVLPNIELSVKCK